MRSSTKCSNRIPAAFAALLFVAACAGTGSSPARQGSNRIRIAVLPVENLHGATAPVNDIRQSLVNRLQEQGVDLVGGQDLDVFLEKKRIRFTSGVDPAESKAFKEEAGVDAVLITSCELYSGSSGSTAAGIPKIALTSRLVATGASPQVVWMDSIGVSGDDSPGILGIGVIEDAATLAEKATNKLSDSLVEHLSGKRKPSAGKKSLEPKISFRSPVIGSDLRENTVGFVLKRSEGDEGSGRARLAVMLNARTGKTVTVDYAVTGGTAQGKGVDYALREGTLLFGPGETIKHIELEIVDDALYEGDETVEVTLKNPKNAVLGEIATHTYTIVDNDPVPTVRFLPAVRNVPESVGSVTVQVELSGVTGKDVIVPFTTGGTARDQADYRVLTPSPVVIKAGQRSAGITTAILDNRVKEPDKTIEIALENPLNAVLGSLHIHRFTIMDNDGRPTIAVLPFFNASPRKNAGEILMLHFVRELQSLEQFEVIEPGVVRQQLLNMRVVMDTGMSLSDADLVFNSVDADLILCGRVMDYQDYEFFHGAPKVDFAVEVLERRSRKIVWSSKSYHQGDESIILFDWGRVNTASDLAAEMVRVIANKIVTE